MMLNVAYENPVCCNVQSLIMCVSMNHKMNEKNTLLSLQVYDMNDLIIMGWKIDVEILAHSYEGLGAGKMHSYEGLGAGKMLLSTKTKVG